MENWQKEDFMTAIQNLFVQAIGKLVSHGPSLALALLVIGGLVFYIRYSEQKCEQKLLMMSNDLQSLTTRFDSLSHNLTDCRVTNAKLQVTNAVLEEQLRLLESPSLRKRARRIY